MKRKGAKAGSAILLITTAMALAACEPTYVNHGFSPQRAELDNIVAGEDTRGSVMRKLGHPSTASSLIRMPGIMRLHGWSITPSTHRR